MLRVGLTGGIGSGKSTVAALFEQKSIPVIDADEIAHELTRPGQPVLKQIIETFGRRVLLADGSLDRVRMRELVFSSPAQRERLEALIHPRVWIVMRDRMAVLNTPYCIASVPLLIEVEATNEVDRVLVVDIPTHVQKLRLTATRDLREDQIEAIINAQASRQTRLDAADDIIDNSGPVETLDSQVQHLHEKYLELARA